MSEHERVMQSKIEELTAENEALKGNGKSRGFLVEKLRLNIGTAVTVIISLVCATWYLQGMLFQVQTNQRDLGDGLREIRRITEELKGSVSNDRWKASHMRVYSYELQRRNATLVVPDVDVIRRSSE